MRKLYIKETCFIKKTHHCLWTNEIKISVSWIFCNNNNNVNHNNLMKTDLIWNFGYLNTNIFVLGMLPFIEISRIFYIRRIAHIVLPLLLVSDYNVSLNLCLKVSATKTYVCNRKCGSHENVFLLRKSWNIRQTPVYLVMSILNHKHCSNSMINFPDTNAQKCILLMKNLAI